MCFVVFCVGERASCGCVRTSVFHTPAPAINSRVSVACLVILYDMHMRLWTRHAGGIAWVGCAAERAALPRRMVPLHCCLQEAGGALARNIVVEQKKVRPAVRKPMRPCISCDMCTSVPADACMDPLRSVGLSVHPCFDVSVLHAWVTVRMHASVRSRAYCRYLRPAMVPSLPLRLSMVCTCGLQARARRSNASSTKVHAVQYTINCCIVSILCGWTNYPKKGIAQ